METSFPTVMSAITRLMASRWTSSLGLHSSSRISRISPFLVEEEKNLESLPFLLREDRLDDARVVFEIRLSGEGGGVWTVEIQDGACRVWNDFADHADVRYTADARAWCAVALGMMDARDAVKRGLMTKDGAPKAMDHYFYQIARRDLEPNHVASNARESAGPDGPKKDGRIPVGLSERSQE